MNTRRLATVFVHSIAPLAIMGLFISLFHDKIFQPEVIMYSIIVMSFYLSFYLFFVSTIWKYVGEKHHANTLMSELRNVQRSTLRSGPQHKQLRPVLDMVFDGSPPPLIDELASSVCLRAESGVPQSVESVTQELLEKDASGFRSIATLARDVSLSVGILGTFLGFMDAMQGMTGGLTIGPALSGLREAVGSSLMAVAATIGVACAELLILRVQESLNSSFTSLSHSLLDLLPSGTEEIRSLSHDIAAYLEGQKSKIDSLLDRSVSASANVEDAVKAVEGRLPKAIAGLASSTESVGNTLSRVDSALSGAKVQSESLSAAGEALATTVTGATSSFQRLASEIEHRMQNLGTLTNALLSTQPYLESTLRPAMEEISSTTRHMSECSLQMQTATRDLNKTVAALEGPVRAFSGPLDHMSQSISALATAVDGLNAYLSDARQSTVQLEDRYLETLAQLAVDVGNTAKQLGDTASSNAELAAAVSASRADISAAIQSFESKGDRGLLAGLAGSGRRLFERIRNRKRSETQGIGIEQKPLQEGSTREE